MRIRIAVAALLSVFVLATACGESGGTADRLQVVATVYPLGFFAERVGGDRVEVNVLVGPGLEAHGFEPTASDLLALGDADVIVMNGIGLEPWVDGAIEALDGNVSGVVVEAADPVRAMDGEVHGHGEEEAEHDDEESELDPHMWLNPTLAASQVERIRDAFVAADPANADAYRRRAAELIVELTALDAEFAESLGACTHEHFVTSHAAYGYLAAQYGLEQIAVAGLSADVAPSPQRLAQVTDRVTELGLGHVLVEPVLSDRLAQTIARETGIELLAVHAIGSVTDNELEVHGDYFGLMRDNLASLRTALECE